MTDAKALRALVRKYEEIIRLREQALSDPTLDPRREMATLASEFPGALREADELPMEELHRRLNALAAADAGTADVAPWMHAMTRFHALTRGALCAKKWLDGRKVVDAGLVREFEAALGGFCYAEDAGEWKGELAVLASPPRGRVTEVVFARMGRELGVGADEVRGMVFVGRRGG